MFEGKNKNILERKISIMKKLLVATAFLTSLVSSVSAFPLSEMSQVENQISAPTVQITDDKEELACSGTVIQSENVDGKMETLILTARHCLKLKTNKNGKPGNTYTKNYEVYVYIYDD